MKDNTEAWLKTLQVIGDNKECRKWLDAFEEHIDSGINRGEFSESFSVDVDKTDADNFRRAITYLKHREGYNVHTKVKESIMSYQVDVEVKWNNVKLNRD